MLLNSYVYTIHHSWPEEGCSLNHVSKMSFQDISQVTCLFDFRVLFSPKLFHFRHPIKPTYNSIPYLKGLVYKNF
jgi:hypothetical protein